ncbi:L-lysine 2,3-aminomutase [bioreactor metagenome]|jgi:lysine 2,3-aminomutase|uniref:Lysine 2,3-aminomutase YodO family protein n=2 Tax=root TaxID=1 RepID=A0A652ZXE6_9SPIR|nr:KamA family radical SAM protein [Treponema sp.]VBB40442.1 Lysine 2,3-aminomutase YodO family protein [uncultured Spirochaetota bacterium]HOI23389.1 KamA family radical SAM protein [Spirochaetales bacterium]
MSDVSPLSETLERKGLLPFAAPSYWLNLASEDYRTCRRDENGVPLDPILAQALPSAAELIDAPLESEDPLREKEHSPLPRLVHQYSSRLLIRVTGACPLYCRHCFRRNLLPSEREFISSKEILQAQGYLKEHPELREVLISGGDPLSVPTEILETLFARLREARPGIFLRLCTRAPVSLPERIDEALLSMLRKYKPLRLVIQANHPKELSGLFLEKIEKVLAAGIPVRSQTVLLKGVNDDTNTLETLFSGLCRAGVDPYYLFQGDLARGSSHFRVPLSRGLAMYEELRTRLSGLEMPRYAVDAPDGAGKLYLPESVVSRQEDEQGAYWLLRAPDGSLHRYPEEA